MTTAVQHRRGTTAEHSTFTGLEGEVTIDTTKDTAVIHDGVLAGGYPLAKENLANVTTSGLSSIDGASTASDDKFFIYDQSATTLKTITRAELNNAIEQDALANVAITGGTINGTAIGGTTAAAGAFSTLSASGAVTLSGGTANSIPYLNGSKVLTTGSALTFDGTLLSLTGNQKVTGYMELRSANRIYFDDSGNTNSASIYNGGAGANLTFGDSGSGQWMTLTSTGLGIGTSSPASKLDVSAIGAGIQLKQSATGSATYYVMDTTVETGGKRWRFGYSGAAGFSAFSLYNQTDNITSWVADASGNLGLGVTPSAWLTSSSTKAMQIGNLTLQDQASGGVLYSYLGSNYYQGSDTNFKYTTANYATQYEQSAGKHIWKYAASGSIGGNITFTQAMTLDASGNLGVGATSTSYRMEVVAPSGDNITALFRSGDATAANNAGGGFRSISSATAASRIAQLWLDADGANFSGGDYFYIQKNGNSGTADIVQYSNAAMTFATNATERARITSGGYFKASNTGTYQSSTSTYHELRNDANANTVRISNTIASGYTDAVAQIAITGYSPNTTNSWFLFCNDSVATRAEIRSNGGIANYSANDVNLSDRREKTNFAPAKSYLDTICAIPVQTFNYIDQNLEEDPGTTLGVVAQDVQAVAPELVMESNWGTKDEPKMRLSIYQTDLQYALMKALQELKAEFDAYKATHP